MPNYKRKACIAAILLCSLITAFFPDCTVVQGAVRTISLDAASKTVLAGKTITFHLKNKPKNAVCKWTANNKNIVSISGNVVLVVLVYTELRSNMLRSGAYR